MFEEVPRERRGVAGRLPVRRVVLGPFVLGGGMLLATLGGSVAVAAAAATMITASAIGSDDVPARPGQAVASATTHQTLSARRPPARHPVAAPAATGQTTAGHLPGVTLAASAPHSAPAPRPPAAAPATAVRTVTARPPVHVVVPTAVAPRPATSTSPTPAPSSSSAPLGNAVIHVSGYDRTGERLAYQFAAARPGADGADVYEVVDPTTFTAPLASSLTITSGGALCPPAGSACTVDQLIGAADSGFFAVVAIDARGELRSIVEVADQPAEPKLIPAPSSSSTAGDGYRQARPGGPSPAPSSSSAVTS